MYIYFHSIAYLHIVFRMKIEDSEGKLRVLLPLRSIRVLWKKQGSKSLLATSFLIS